MYLLDLVTCLAIPWYFLFVSVTYLPGAILRLHRSGERNALRSWSNIQRAWFKDFWSWLGVGIRAENGPRITALLEGRVTGGAVATDRVHHGPVGGVVLDVGPGPGYWVDVLAPFCCGGGKGNVTKIYGVEPSAESHDELTARVRRAGLDGTYEIVPRGIESLGDARPGGPTVQKGSVDCILTILCLCSIPDPERNISELYQYLKPGGRWYMYEHVQIRHSLLMRLYQGKSIWKRWWAEWAGGADRHVQVWSMYSGLVASAVVNCVGTPPPLYATPVRGRPSISQSRRRRNGTLWCRTSLEY